MKEAVSEVLENLDINSLWPWQERAINDILNTDKNFIVKAPTGSGKSLVAYVVIKEHLKDGRIIYAVPAVALANEKAKELQKALGKNVVVKRIGTSDSLKGDIIIGTYEKVFTLLRHHKALLNSISLAILDDFHILYDPHRGPKLEKLIAFLLSANIRILALSATIHPINTLRAWLNADYIEGKVSRHVKVHTEFINVDKKQLLSLLVEHKNKYSPAIIFCKSKAETKRLAEDVFELLKSMSNQQTLSSWGFGSRITRHKQKFATDVIEDFDTMGVEATEDIKLLAQAIEKGIAWHHANLKPYVRAYIENLFKKGYLDYVFATTTLAHGINTPAKSVIIFPKRWTPIRNWEWIKCYEWLQMAGRAGRPGFVKSEDVYILTIISTNKDVQEAKQRYRVDRIEEVESHLVNEELEQFFMELIDAGYTTEEELLKIYENTYSVSKRTYDISCRLAYVNPMAKKMLIKRQHDQITSVMSSLILKEWVDYVTGYRLTKIGKIVLDFLDSSFTPWSLSKIVEVINYFKKLLGTSIDLPLSAYDVALPIIEIFGPQLQIYPPKEQMEVQSEKIKHLRQKLLETGIDIDTYSENSLFTWYILKERWAKGVPILAIEAEFGTWATYIDTITKPLTEVLRNLVKPLAEYYNIPLSSEYDNEVIEIEYGVPRDVVSLLELDRFGRVRVLELYNWVSRNWGDFLKVLILKGSDESSDLLSLQNELKIILETEGFLAFLNRLYLEAKKRGSVDDFKRFIEDIHGIAGVLSQRLVEFLEERQKRR